MSQHEEELHVASFVLTNLNGTTGDIDDDPNSPDSNWLTTSDAGSATQMDGTFEDPSATITGTQNFWVQVRATNNSSREPDVTITLDDGSTPVSGVTVTPGTTVVFGPSDGLTLDASAISDQNNVTITVDGSSTGGPGSQRNTIEVGAVQWDANLNLFVTATTEAATSINPTSGQINGSFDFATYSSIDVWFEWREVGASSWNTTTVTNYVSPGSHSEVISGLSPNTEYEFRLQVQSGDGSETDTGATLAFYTTILVEGTVDVGGSTVSGVTVRIIGVNESTPSATLLQTESTAADGTYSAEVTGGDYDIHVAASYDDGSTKYAGESKPYIGA